MKKIIYAILLTFSFITCAKAEQTLTTKDIESYLNKIKTIEADFIQTASNGSYGKGKLYIQKPNKINMQYDENTNVSIIGDGKYVVYHDKDLDQVTHINYKDIPATLILGNDIKIDGKAIKARDFYQDEGVTSVTFDYLDNDSVGPITLTFDNSPLKLRQWKIIDPQGIEIIISLYNIKQDGKLDSGLFKFKNKKYNPLSK